jgi:cytoskeletal protein CcmA (bactofilin family)
VIQLIEKSANSCYDLSMQKLMLFIISCFIFLSAAGLQPASAADIRSGHDLTIPATATNLKDLYLFGGTIRVDAPVTNDLVAAGGNITVTKPVSGNLIIAGGDLTVSGPVNNTIRAAGGTITIDAPVARDLVIAGGDITVTQKAAVNGDAVINGGTVTLEGPVNGKVIINGGDITINSSVSGNVSGNVGTLKLGPHAVINGNLSYTSREKADSAQGAVVNGKTNYTQRKAPEHRGQEFLAYSSFYKLLTDIILSVLFIFFFSRSLTVLLARMTTKPVESGAIGLAFLIFFPMLAFILLLLIWLGIATFLAYFLVLLVSIFLVKVFIGWYIMRWWENRNKKTYVLDWKAGVIGPIVLFGMLLIPGLGWLAGALLMFVATGAVVQEASTLMSGQKLLPHKTTKKK